MKTLFSLGYHVIFLWLMRDEPIYGYKLAKDFEKMTKGYISISSGTIYPFLRRMEKEGLLTSTKDKSSGKTYYNFTKQGKTALNQLSNKIKELKDIFDKRLLGLLSIYENLYDQESLSKLLKEFLK